MFSPSSLSKETLEKIVEWAEIFTFAFTFIGAFSGVAYLIFNKPLKKIEAEERRLERQKSEHDALELRGQVAELEKDAADAKARQAEAETALEKERKERAEMEAAIAPRLVDEGVLANKLKSIPGISVRIVSSAEGEPWRLAGALAMTFQMAGWNVLSPMERVADTGYENMVGVTVAAEVGLPRHGDRSNEAAELLAAELNGQKIKSHRVPSGDLPVNTILVKIGLKPIEHFGQKGQGLLYK